MRVWGVNPVREALGAGRATRLIVKAGSETRLADIVALAKDAGVPIDRTSPAALDRMARGGVHQGVAAEIADARPLGVRDLVARATAAPLIVVLDGVEDPHNLGAILRTADAAGADGVIRQTRRAAALGGAAAKASAGASAHVRIADVVNIARTIEELKEAGVWTVGLAGDAAMSYEQVDLTLPTAFVLGAEGTGLRRLVRDRCDWLVSIPMAGRVGSLNVSVAAGVALFEAVRQRRRAAEGRQEGAPEPTKPNRGG